MHLNNQAQQTAIDALEAVETAATHEDPDPGTNSLVRRNAVLGTSIANLNVLSRETAYAPTESWPPSGLTFDHATTLGHIDLLANARLLFQPYDAQGNPLSDRIFSFGRAVPESVGSTPDPKEDGLLMVDETLGISAKIILDASEATLELQGSKATEQQGDMTVPVCPVFLVRNGSGDSVYDRAPTRTS